MTWIVTRAVTLDARRAQLRFMTTTTMTSQHIRTLLTPPNVDASHANTLTLLNAQFKSLDDLDDLDPSVEQALEHRHNLTSQVRLYPRSI